MLMSSLSGVVSSVSLCASQLQSCTHYKLQDRGESEVKATEAACFKPQRHKMDRFL